MSEKKLTVAELMSRTAKERGDKEVTPRRRRRSLESGGVSIAELTGSIPAVKKKPAESRHSSVPLDTPEPVADAPASQPVQNIEDVPPPSFSSPEPVQSAEKPEPKVSEFEQVAPEPEPVVPEQVTTQAEKLESEEAQPEAPQRVPSSKETVVLSIVGENEPVKLTTGAFPVVPTAAVELAKPTKVVEPEPEPEQTSESAPLPGFEEAATTTEPAVNVAVADSADLEQTVESDVDADVDAEVEEEAKVSVFSIFVMAIIGVVLGVVVFIAFQLLWTRLNVWLVGSLAVVVTLGLVGLVHALRTSRDRFSMFLAGVAGLIMTFGPALTVLDILN